MTAKRRRTPAKKSGARRTRDGVRRTARTLARAARGRARAKSTRRAFVDRKKPETLRLRSAGPSLTVNDIHKSLAFYRDVLGFTLGEHYEHDGRLAGVELKAGQVSFWLSQDDWKKGKDRVKGQGFRIYCSTTQDVDALAAKVKARGGTLAQEPTSQPWGGRDFGVVDPDGFAITIASGI